MYIYKICDWRIRRHLLLSLSITCLYSNILALLMQMYQIRMLFKNVSQLQIKAFFSVHSHLIFIINMLYFVTSIIKGTNELYGYPSKICKVANCLTRLSYFHLSNILNTFLTLETAIYINQSCFCIFALVHRTQNNCWSREVKWIVYIQK